ncbi:MAG TPA: hypothetical protein VKX28_20450 [Xanthobacteraceae bacterium]|nr:hypothetical protein [Xanthobacteraceae bacterium]
MLLSAAKLAANRANAMKSTGPRTAAGKARAAQNARLHGLRAAVLADEGFTQEVKDLARLFAGEGAPQEVFALACRLAETHLTYSRIREIRLQVIRQDPDLTKTPARTIRRVAAIDRHAGRAFSRRSRALRAFTAGCVENRWVPPDYKRPGAPVGERVGQSGQMSTSDQMRSSGATPNSDADEPKPPERSHDELSARNSFATSSLEQTQRARTNPAAK